MRSPLALFRSITEIRERESGRLLLMATYLLLVITCYTVTKAARDSLFIVAVGPAQLPYLYVTSALCMGLVSAIYPRALRGIGLYALIRLTSLIAISNLLAFWWLMERPGVMWFYILYVWVSLFGAITASQAWSLATHVFDAREARRSFAWIGLGGVLGGIAGGALAKFLAPRWGTEVLLPLCAPLMMTTVFLLHRLAPSQISENGVTTSAIPTEPEAPATSVLGQIRSSRYLSLVVGLLVTGVIVEAFVDYEFKWISNHAFQSKDALTSFFGTMAFYGGILALLVQTLFTGRFLKKFGVGYTIMLLPAAYLGSFLLIAARPTLWAASILKLIDGSLSHSVHRSGMELLYVPISEKQRAAVKGVIDLLVDRAGRAVGGILLLLLTLGLSFSITWLSLVAAGFLGAWLMISLVVRRDYIDAFRVALEMKVVRPEAIDVRALDLTMIRSLVQALSSKDERQVLYALDLLGQTHPSHWRNSLPALLVHPSPAVRSRAIALLADWRDTSASTVSSRLADADIDVRAETIRYLCDTSPQRERTLHEFLMSPDYQIVLAAVHYLAKHGGSEVALIDEAFIERALQTTGEHTTTARIAAARVLSMVPGDRSGEFLEVLLADRSPQVVQAAIRSAARLRYENAIPRLVEMLSNGRLRLTAREALLALGPASIVELKRRLHDERTPMEVRSRIPKALSFIGSQEVCDMLLDSVQRLTPKLDLPLLKALNRMRKQFSHLSFNVKRASRRIKQQSQKYRHWSAVLSAMGSSIPRNPRSADVIDLLHKTLNEKLDECIEKTFRLLALIYSPDDVYSAFFNLRTRPALRGSAVEFLDNLLDPDLRSHVVRMIESEEPGEVQDEISAAPLSSDDILRALLSSGDDWLIAIAGELSDRAGLIPAPSRTA
jgi:AAA family ATP:ADP antiporter